MNKSTQSILFTLALLVMLGRVQAAAAAESGFECAEIFTDRPVRFVVPVRPGGGYDSYIRIIARLFADRTGASTRVLNIAGGLSLPALRDVTDSTDDAVAVGLFDRAKLIHLIEENSFPLAEDYRLLGLVSSAPHGWLAKPGFDLLANRDRRLVTAGVDAVLDALRVGLASSAMDLDTALVAGYGGSGEELAAVERGDVDFASISQPSIERAVRGSNLVPILFLSDEPVASFPDVPYLAGIGGLVDQLTRGANPEQRNRAMEIASVTEALTESARVLITSALLSPGLSQCLVTEMEALLFSTEFANQAAASNLPANPLSARDTENQLNEIHSITSQYRELLLEIIAQVRR